MSKSFALWSAVRKLFRTDKRSGPCEGEKKKKYSGESEAIAEEYICVSKAVHNSKEVVSLLENIQKSSNKLADLGIIVKSEVSTDDLKWKAHFGL